MPNTGTITGLSPATSYALDAMHVDDWGNVSAVVSSDPFTTAAAPAGPTPSVITQTLTQNNDGDFSGVQLGTEAVNRKIYVFGAFAAGDEPTGCTIAGVAASVTDQQQVENFTAENVMIWEADVPAGVSGDVVFTGGGAQNHAIAAVATYGRTASTTKDFTPGGGNLDLSANVASGDEVFALALERNGISGWGWVGVVENSDLDLRTSEFTSFAAAQGLSAENPRTITAITSTAGAAAAIALVLT